jgi:hypothetical protein
MTFHDDLERVLVGEAERFLGSVPYADHLTNPETELNEAYYLRHRVECIKRIRLTSKLDALALASLIEEDYDAARPWSRYVAEELDHDSLYTRDLAQHGFTSAQIESIPLFPSTRAMLDYLLGQTAALGALPGIAYSVFVEWNSDLYSRQAVAKAEAHYSATHVSGSKAHAAIDQDEDHFGMLLDLARRLVAARGDSAVFFSTVQDIAGYYRTYFRELYAETILQTAETSAPLVH